MSEWLTTRSAWLIMGERMRDIGASTPARRIASIFSILEPPSPATPVKFPSQ